ncbi:MAG: hypothetical protein Ct9H90mP20_1700 [Candidatus Neomarinimicrobiota bacterium]|nr:MAG: hypothetical protein Ct9H90mP20_1700 [Candidatus Neomarinimicrobiota bacterium]
MGYQRTYFNSFLTEAFFLCQVGGIIGVVFGIAAGNLISFVAKVPAVIPIDWAIYGVVSCSLIGIGFGSYLLGELRILIQLNLCDSNKTYFEHSCSYTAVLINLGSLLFVNTMIDVLIGLNY